MQLNQQGKQIFYLIIYIQAKTIIKTYIPNKGYTNINKNKHSVKKKEITYFHTIRAQSHIHAHRHTLTRVDLSYFIWTSLM